MAQVIYVFFVLSTLILFGKGIPLDCYRTTPSRYDGHQQMTINGVACVRWDSFDNDFSLATVADAANYCRNPDKDENLWCFTGRLSTTWNICGINKCEYVNVNQCGRLSIEQPTILGRNVLFTFTPYTNKSNAILQWQQTDKRRPWATLPVNYKFTQYFKDGTYYLLLTDTVRYVDEIYYRIYYDDKSVRCFMETPKLVLKDISSNPCGFVYLKTKRAKVNEMVELEYYPSESVMGNPEHFLRQWTHLQFANRTIPIQLSEDTYIESKEPNDKYVLTIKMSSRRMNGLYKVYCGKAAGYSNEVTVTLPDPPSAPAFEGLNDIDDCRGCIVDAPEIELNISGSELNIFKGDQAFVKCSAESAPVSNISWIERTDERNVTKKQCHLTTYCVLTIDAHLVPQRHLFCQTHYLQEIDRKDLTVFNWDAPEIEFNISGSELNISKAEQTFVKCSAKSAPASNISWIETTDGRNITKKQCHMTTYCVIEIDTHLVSQRHLFCQTRYLHKTDLKVLTVYIWGEDDQLSKDQEDSVSGVKLIFWIIVGSCIAIVAVVSIAVIIVCLVVRGIKQRNAREQGTNRVIYIASDDGDRGGLEVAGRKS